MHALRVKVAIIGSGPAGYAAGRKLGLRSTIAKCHRTLLVVVSQNAASRPSAPNTARRSEMYTASR